MDFRFKGKNLMKSNLDNLLDVGKSDALPINLKNLDEYLVCLYRCWQVWCTANPSWRLEDLGKSWSMLACLMYCQSILYQVKFLWIKIEKEYANLSCFWAILHAKLCNLKLKRFKVNNELFETEIQRNKWSNWPARPMQRLSRFVHLIWSDLEGSDYTPFETISMLMVNCGFKVTLKSKLIKQND